MTTKEEIIDDWGKRHRLPVPSSWKEDTTKILPLMYIDSLVSGCVVTYIGLHSGEKLDKPRLDVLIVCRNRLEEAQTSLTDDAGKAYLHFNLRLIDLMLADSDLAPARRFSSRTTS